MRKKVKVKYRYHIRLERASQEQLNGSNKSSAGNVESTTVPVHLQLGQLTMCKMMKFALTSTTN